MGQKIINLDELLGEDKYVTAKGKTYALPPDIDAELFLRINRVSSEGTAGELHNIQALHDDLLEMFRYGDAEITKLPLTMKQLFSTIPRVYGASDDDEDSTDDGDVPPPPARTRGGASSRSRKPAKRSR